MKNIYLNVYKSNLANLKKAKKSVENNGVIGIPTETVYGLAGNAYSKISIKKIFKLKKRPKYNPLILHYAHLNKLKEDVSINQSFTKLYKQLCPGPITFILNKKAKSKISKIVNAGKKTFAIRFPKHKVARDLLKILNFPLAAPSANIFSKLSPTSAKDVVDEFNGKIKIILDGGSCKIGLESTILDLTSRPTILRQGSITQKKIEKILKTKVFLQKKISIIKSPGQLNFHYSPGLPVLMNKNLPINNGAFITFGKNFKNKKNYFNLSQKGNLNEAANNLYKTMRKIKKLKYQSISVCTIPNIGIGQAINDRLKKASFK
jgi:L-threonylcarbamoyladenylate synthase